MHFIMKCGIQYIYGLISSLCLTVRQQISNRSHFLYFIFYFYNTHCTITVFDDNEVVVVILSKLLFLSCSIYLFNSEVLVLYFVLPCLSAVFRRYKRFLSCCFYVKQAHVI